MLVALTLACVALMTLFWLELLGRKRKKLIRKPVPILCVHSNIEIERKRLK